MLNRRAFLHSAGPAGFGLRAAAQTSKPQPPPTAPPASDVQVPRMKFAGAEISRLIVGCFSSIKPTDGVFVGMFPRAGDEVRHDAERVHRILASA